MGKRLEIFGELRIVDETNGLDWTLLRQESMCVRVLFTLSKSRGVISPVLAGLTFDL